MKLKEASGSARKKKRKCVKPKECHSLSTQNAHEQHTKGLEGSQRSQKENPALCAPMDGKWTRGVPGYGTV